MHWFLQTIAVVALIECSIAQYAPPFAYPAYPHEEYPSHPHPQPHGHFPSSHSHGHVSAAHVHVPVPVPTVHSHPYAPVHSHSHPAPPAHAHLTPAHSHHAVVAAHPPSPQPYDEPESPPNRFLCHGKSIGNYVDPINPCSTTFYSCVADGYPAQGLERECPHHPKVLYFSEEHDKCLEKIFVKACETHDKEETEFERFLRVHNNFAAECRDGKYEHPDQPCSHRYVLCDHGHIQVQECPFPDFLRFDSATQRCLEERFVQSCKSEEEQIEESRQQPALTAEHVQCTHADQTYFVPNPAEACSGHYFACLDGKAFAMKCPKNLFFDKISGDCLARQLCPACVQLIVTESHVHGHSHAQSYGPHALPFGHNHHNLGHNHYGPVPTQLPAHHVPVPHVHGHSGYGPVPSSHHVVSPKFGHKLSHPVDHHHHVPAVHAHGHGYGYVEEHHQIAHSHASLSKFNIATNQHHKHIVPSVVSHSHLTVGHSHPRNTEFVCWTKPNGNYSRGDCEATYYECAHGLLTVKPCPYGLFFSPSERICAPVEQISTCAGDVDFCAGRYDGIYAIDCQSYVFCHGGVGIKTLCKEGEAFHSGEHRCMAKELCPSPCNM